MLENNVIGIAYQRNLHGAEGGKQAKIGRPRHAIWITSGDPEPAARGRGPRQIPLGCGRAEAALDLP